MQIAILPVKRRCDDCIRGQITISQPKTKQAVQDFQKAYNLPATGVVDNATWLKLYDEYVGIATTSLANANLPISPSEIENQFQAGQFPGYPLSYGSND